MIRAVVSNGKIEIDAPADCRDGEAVSIYLMPHGIEDGEMTGEEKQQLLSALDRFESLVPKSDDLAEELSEVVRLIALEEKKGIAAYPLSLSCETHYFPGPFSSGSVPENEKNVKMRSIISRLKDRAFPGLLGGA